jgi:hypothetical protein
MAWIKRNLFFVISVAIGLAATGYCGWLLYAALGQTRTAGEDYTQKLKSLQDLQNKKPLPTPESIAAAQADEERVRQFLADFHKAFGDFPAPAKLDPHGFKDYLQRTISRWGLEATNAEVGLTPNYNFSFQEQMDTLSLPAENIEPWMQQMEQIGAILHILYKAKINFLVRIQRPAVSQDDNNGDDVMPLTGGTNQWGVVTPYKAEFRGFSTDVAAVLAGFAGATNCFVVKTIIVAPSHIPVETLAPPPPVTAPAQAPTMIYRPVTPIPQFNPFGPGEFGRGNRGYGERRMMPRPMPMPQQAQVPVVPAGPAPPEKVLAEAPLFVTIFVDVIKLKAPETPKAPEKPSRGARPRLAEH